MTTMPPLADEAFSSSEKHNLCSLMYKWFSYSVSTLIIMQIGCWTNHCCCNYTACQPIHPCELKSCKVHIQHVSCTCIILLDMSREFPSFIHVNWYNASTISSITAAVHNNSTASPESPVNNVGDMLAVTVGANKRVQT